MTLANVPWKNMKASIITDVETERKCKKSMRTRYGCCVKLREKIQAIRNCLVDEGKLIKRHIQKKTW